jgi:hypothetical protein
LNRVPEPHPAGSAPAPKFIARVERGRTKTEQLIFTSIELRVDHDYVI